MEKCCSDFSMAANSMMIILLMATILCARGDRVSSRRRSLADNGLGLTTQMGWNSWNHFNCNMNETIIRETADAIVSTGLAAVGYNYVNIGKGSFINTYKPLFTWLEINPGSEYICCTCNIADDCWGELNRDAEGNMVANKASFPSGIKALADQGSQVGD